jgi:hypothetical protein
MSVSGSVGDTPEVRMPSVHDGLRVRHRQKSKRSFLEEARMNVTRATTWLVSITALVVGCSHPGAGDKRSLPRRTGEDPTFINRVWIVAESTGMTPDQLVVFLSEGTLVFASPNETPALGTWSDDDGCLTMVEAGIAYEVDILGISSSEFRIRSHNPGGFVDTRFVPADGPAPPE